MKRTVLTGILALAAGVPALMAQAGQAAPAAQAAPAGQTAPAAPAVPPEQAAWRAVVDAYNQNKPDAAIKASEDLVNGFPNSPYKEPALSVEAMSYEMKNDSPDAQVAWGRVIEANAKSIQGNLKLGEIIAKNTRDKDLDRDDQLAKSEKCLKTAIDLLSGPKPNPQMPDQVWDTQRKQLDAEAHNDLGLIALTRATANKDTDPQKYAPAIAEFQTASTEDPDQPTYPARLAAVYQNAGKSAEALALCDKILATPDLNPQVKSFVDSVKAAASKAPAAPAK